MSAKSVTGSIPEQQGTVVLSDGAYAYLGGNNCAVRGNVAHVGGNRCHIIGKVLRLDGLGNQVIGDVDEVNYTGHIVYGNVGRLSGRHHKIYGDVGIVEGDVKDCYISGKIGVDRRVQRYQPIVNICAVSGPGAINTGTVFVSQVQHFGAVAPPPAAAPQVPAIPQTPVAAAGTPSQDDKDQNACVICLDAQRTHVCMPCMHACLCGGCATAIGVGVPCPICRLSVAEVKRFFI